MIVFGPDAANDIMKLSDSFSFEAQYKFAYGNRGNNTYYLFNIPAFYVPTISGVHVLPDLSGKWSEKVHREPQLTSYAHDRRRY